jgi:hypothetical protein
MALSLLLSASQLDEHRTATGSKRRFVRRCGSILVPVLKFEVRQNSSGFGHACDSLEKDKDVRDVIPSFRRRQCFRSTLTQVRSKAENENELWFGKVIPFRPRPQQEQVLDMIFSISNPQQVLPSAKVPLESQARIYLLPCIEDFPTSNVRADETHRLVA